MSPRAALCCWIWMLAIALPAAAADFDTRPRPRDAADRSLIHGGLAEPAKALVDSHLVVGPWGSGATYNGQFQDAVGAAAALNDPADPDSWTSVDLTQRTVSPWHADTYLAIAGLVSAWCGDLAYGSCSGLDPEGGYGNNYDEWLVWTAVVPNPGAPTTAQVTALVQYDVESGYDSVQLECLKRGQAPQALWLQDGQGDGVTVDVDCTYLPEDYLGDANDEISLRWRVTSDTAFSDQDCLYQSAGALRVDDVTVTWINDGNSLSTVDDFEDGTLGPNWTPEFPVGVGDFAQIWTGLEDIDACATNYSPQVAFIDDGLVVPGTGGTWCLNWCYGPSGYIVNTTGGLAGPDFHLDNAVESPVMAWPDPADAYCRLDFSVYHHEDLSADSPGIFYTWAVRSTDSPDPDDILTRPWQDRIVLYSEGYSRLQFDVSDLLQPGRRTVQIQLAARELGYFWGYTGDDGTPAPYFDDVRLTTAPFEGPALTADEADLANDGFPASGTIDLADPSELSVRFDMARNIAPDDHLRNDPGDSIVARITAVRTGAAVDPYSVFLHYALSPNTLFDPYRTGMPNTGSVAGKPTALQDRWSFDLPDTGFLFPGDVLHYYLEAADNAAGDIRTATLPADLAGFGDFGGTWNYDPRFTVRALPSLDADGDTPPILVWLDLGGRADEDAWRSTIDELYWLAFADMIDVYRTNNAAGGLGNGLGGRATAAQLAPYQDLLYGCGDLGAFTLSNGDFTGDPSADLQLLDAWLEQGFKDLLLMGDNLVSDLDGNAGGAGLAFLSDRMGVGWAADDLRYLIGNQTAPTVQGEDYNPVFQTIPDWIAYGGCPGINTFDAVVTVGDAQRLAQFLDSSGGTGAFSYSAAALKITGPDVSRVLSVPYGLSSVLASPQAARLQSGPARFLTDVLVYFDNEITDVPGATAAFAVHCRPNPFNPQTRIEYTLPAAGRLTLKIYDLRGALTRTLIDGHVPGSGFAVWDGRDDGGARVSSGLYFYEARTAAQVRTGKVTLLK